MTPACPLCGGPVFPQERRSGPPKKYCSKACKDRAVQIRRATDAHRQAAAARSVERNRMQHALRGRVTACRVCDAQFCPVFGRQSHSRTCSLDCSAELDRRMRCRKQAARKARKRLGSADPIDPISVFVRYKWRCARCRTRTPEDFRGSVRPNAPELDHIIPLALGGPHSETNVQLLCRACNRSKSAQRINLL